MTLKDWYRARFVDTNEGLARMRVCYPMSVSYHSIVFMCIIKENLIINELKLLEGPSNSMASEPQTMLTMHAYDTTFYGASLASDAVQYVH